MWWKGFKTPTFLAIFFSYIYKWLEKHQPKIRKKKRKDSKSSWKISKSYWEKKPKKREYGPEPYTNLPENEKQKLVEFTKKY